MGKKKKEIIGNVFSYKWDVYLPSTIRLDNILLDYPLTVTYNEDNPIKIRDNLAYILGQIHSSLVNKKGDKFPSNQYTPICAKNFQKVVKNYKQYLEYAENLGIIQNDGNYYFNNDREDVKTKCIHYKFTERYFDSNTKWYKYSIYDSKIRSAAVRFGQPLREHKKYINLKTMFDYIGVDLKACRKTLESIYPKDSQEIEGQLDTARRINHRALRSFSVGKTGRLYSPFSNLHKSLRKHVTLNGEQLFELDIVSSIPYMSLVLFDNERLEKSPNINRLLRQSNKYITPELITDQDIRIVEDKVRGWGKHSYIGKGIGIHVHIGKNDHLDTTPNIKRFKSMVLDGTLYEYLSEHWNNDSKIKKEYTRKEAKEKLLAILNSPSTFESPERNSLVSLFPDVIEVIDLLNRGYFKTNKGTGKAKKTKHDIDCPFAKFTQGLEAHIVLDLVSNIIANHNPFIKLITLHDAIYVRERDILEVKTMLESKAIETTGNKIKVRVKNLSNDTKLDSNDIIMLQIKAMEKEYNFGKSLSQRYARNGNNLPF